jgi:uncharacterized BrkB/YihY/UPF0761 family membrane protein
MHMKRLGPALVLALLAALCFAIPAQAAIRVSCADCEDIPAWALGLLAVVGVLLAMAILWLPQRLARNLRSQRMGGFIILGGWIFLTIAFVLGVRALVLLLGGT